ncbi:MAG: hypothetical protein HY026_06580 [Deltaproteobacteria bacterium]|nr:hypothetical protein [Deltaproteobacteria bacterium]
MRRFSVIVLLAAALAMNIDVVCKSLCLSGHGGTADAHASHKTINHEMPKSDMCPITHGADHTSHHNIPKTFIKCGCPADDLASLGYELTIAEPVKDLRPYPYIVSKTHSQEIIFLSNEPIPLEGPPKILA